jgi:hypothetical protein
MSDPELYDMVYDEIAEKVIMQYKKLDEARVDDVSITDDFLLDDV